MFLFLLKSWAILTQQGKNMTPLWSIFKIWNGKAFRYKYLGLRQVLSPKC